MARSHTRPTLLLAAVTCLCAAATASAAPPVAKPMDAAPVVEPVQVFKRGRPPVYPYYYAPRRGPNGWSFYFGPVPYQPGNIETQALQRRYPQLNYPPSMRYWNPQTPF